MAFSEKTLDFLFENRVMDSKAWFEAHRADYEALVLEPLRALVRELTPAMLEIGARKVEAAGLIRRIKLTAGDATALRFADGAFDAALCAFGFRNFPDIPASLSEAARILRDGGQLVVLEFFRPRSALLGAITSAWLKAITALFAADRAADYAYLRASIKRTRSAGEFAAMASGAGFALASERFFLPACTCLVLKKCGKMD